jgi:hypothetical protein
MTIEPDSWVYKGWTVSVPDSANSARLAAFARQFSLWAEAKLQAEQKLKNLNRRISES